MITALSGVAWLQVSMQTLNILQSHYPERLGMAVCYYAPRLFSFSFKVHPAQIIHSASPCCHSLRAGALSAALLSCVRAV